MMLTTASLLTLTVETQYGNVTGLEESDYNVFYAIPFAKPPTGNLRWAAPVKSDNWGNLDCTSDEYLPMCAQNNGQDGSEDCLYLNIFQPKNVSMAAVMVYYHGGGFTGGTGLDMDGSSWAKDGIVLVTVNYRLGPFGWFYSEGNFIGNQGLRDQIFALQWVEDNIFEFGGDPDNITIFGGSAGSNSVFNIISRKRQGNDVMYRGERSLAMFESGL